MTPVVSVFHRFRFGHAARATLREAPTVSPLRHTRVQIHAWVCPTLLGSTSSRHWYLLTSFRSGFRKIADARRPTTSNRYPTACELLVILPSDRRSHEIYGFTPSAGRRMKKFPREGRGINSFASRGGIFREESLLCIYYRTRNYIKRREFRVNNNKDIE